MPKVNRNGQAEIFTESDFRRFMGKIKNPNHRIMFFIAWFTGERMGATLKLKVQDVYEHAQLQLPRKEIVFASATRKKTKHGAAETRSVPVHPELAHELSRHEPPDFGLMFSGRDPAKPLLLRSASAAMQRALEKAKLHRKGYSTHSFRRTFITDLSNKGVGLAELQAVTGHKSVEALRGYIQDDPARKVAIINLR